jgi:hypothetical protein
MVGGAFFVGGDVTICDVSILVSGCIGRQVLPNWRFVRGVVQRVGQFSVCTLPFTPVKNFKSRTRNTLKVSSAIGAGLVCDVPFTSTGDGISDGGSDEGFQL